MRFRTRLTAMLGALAVSLALPVTATAQAAPAPDPVEGSVIEPQTWVPRDINPGYGSCPDFHFCAWPGPNATGFGRAYGGNILCGEMWSWEHNSFWNNVESIWNKTTVTLSPFERNPKGQLYEVFPSPSGRVTTPPGSYGNLGDNANMLNGFAYWRC